MRDQVEDPYPERELDYTARATTSARRRSPIGWWTALTAPAEKSVGADFTTRERIRRGRLASVLLLALLVILLGALWQYLIVDDDHPAMKIVLLVALGLVVAAGLLNRAGNVTAAGLLLVVLADLPLAAVPATALEGRVDVLALESFYLLAGSVLVSASLLAPWSVFLVALVNSGLIFATIYSLPHTPALDQLLASNNAQQALIGPVLMLLIVAVVAYLWAQSTLSALRRADRAEEIAALEQREAEHTAELEEGVQQLLAVHVQLANGNFNVRAPTVRNRMLWQIGSSLNNLIGRLARLAQADFVLRRTQEEARHLAGVVQAQRGGRQVVWPVPSGTPLDDVIVALGGAYPMPTTGPAPLAGEVAAPNAPPLLPYTSSFSSNSAPDLSARGRGPMLTRGGEHANDVPAWLFPGTRGADDAPTG